MRKLSLFFPLLAGIIAGCSTAMQAGEFKDNQHALTFKRQITKTVGYDYLLFLPKDYDAKAEKKWPLILFLHGAGERGTNI